MKKNYQISSFEEMFKLLKINYKLFLRLFIILIIFLFIINKYFLERLNRGTTSIYIQINKDKFSQYPVNIFLDSYLNYLNSGKFSDLNFDRSEFFKVNSSSWTLDKQTDLIKVDLSFHFVDKIFLSATESIIKKNMNDFIINKILKFNINIANQCNNSYLRLKSEAQNIIDNKFHVISKKIILADLLRITNLANNHLNEEYLIKFNLDKNATNLDSKTLDSRFKSLKLFQNIIIYEDSMQTIKLSKLDKSFFDQYDILDLKTLIYNADTTLKCLEKFLALSNETELNDLLTVDTKTKIVNLKINFSSIILISLLTSLILFYAYFILYKFNKK